MKLLVYIVVGFLALIASLFLITRGEAPANHPGMLFGIVLLFGIPPAGAFWMIYVAIRYEKNPLPMVLLAFLVPFTFVWYYFERVRPGKLVKNRNFE